MNIKDIVGWIVAIIVAVVGVSKFVIKNKSRSDKSRNVINQTIEHGDGNIQAGRDVNNKYNGGE